MGIEGLDKVLFIGAKEGNPRLAGVFPIKFAEAIVQFGIQSSARCVKDLTRIA